MADSADDAQKPKGITPRPLELNGAQRRYLRSQAHHLKALVSVGKGGVTDGVLDAVKDALDRHELIKVNVPADGAAQRNATGEALSRMTGSHVAQTIGKNRTTLQTAEGERLPIRAAPNQRANHAL